MSIDVIIKKGESVDKALRRLKKKLDRENILRDSRKRRSFEKPSDKKRQRNKLLKFNNMLRLRYENM